MYHRGVPAILPQALNHLIEINLAGHAIEESYATLLLTRILTPFPTSYVDLQSPAAAGRNVLVYNYDGGVYVSDEGRMLAEMGDDRFRMGSVHDSLATLRESNAMRIINDAGNAETLPVCSDCAFVPYCGADPVFTWQRRATRSGIDQRANSASVTLACFTSSSSSSLRATRTYSGCSVMDDAPRRLGTGAPGI